MLRAKWKEGDVSELYKRTPELVQDGEWCQQLKRWKEKQGGG